MICPPNCPGCDGTTVIEVMDWHDPYVAPCPEITARTNRRAEAVDRCAACPAECPMCEVERVDREGELPFMAVVVCVIVAAIVLAVLAVTR